MLSWARASQIHGFLYAFLNRSFSDSRIFVCSLEQELLRFTEVKVWTPTLRLRLAIGPGLELGVGPRVKFKVTVKG
jgi:hypothetical protein